MVSRENNAHCSGGILADDQVISCFIPFFPVYFNHLSNSLVIGTYFTVMQGLGKTISTIALIQKERLQQSRFLSDDSEFFLK
jgi:hypothetical protein